MLKYDDEDEVRKEGRRRAITLNLIEWVTWLKMSLTVSTSKQKKFELVAPENESSPSDSKAEYGKLCNVNDQFPVRFGNCEDNTDCLHVAIVRKLLCQVEGGRVDEKRVLHNQHGRDAFRLC